MKIKVEQISIDLKKVDYYEVEGDKLTLWLSDELEVKVFTVLDKVKMNEIEETIKNYWLENEKNGTK